MEPLGWLAVGAVVAVLLVAADRWVARRPPRPPAHRLRAGGALTGGPGLADVLALYQPTVRHLHEEQERQRHDLVEVGDADGPWGVDLESGTAVVGPEAATDGAPDVDPPAGRPG